MEKFRSGNVVRLAGKNGSPVIITGYRNIISNIFPNSTTLNYRVCDYVYVNFSNTGGYSKVNTITKEESCGCSIVNGNIDPDCEDCDGTGKFMETIFGMDEAVLVASCVKDWITETITNKFNF